MSENKDIQAKSTQIGGLKKSVHKSVLKDGEYHHLKNGITSSFEGDMPFVQNAPSNFPCLELPTSTCQSGENTKFQVIGSVFIKEKDFHVLFLANPVTNESEIGYFYGNDCTYQKVIREKCLNFSVNYPIKSTYQYLKCELNIYFQDGFNRNRHINLDDLPYVKQYNSYTNCYEETDVFDCSIINVQNDLTHPVVKPRTVIEAGALRTGVYQFAVCYANINGDEQSSYFSKTNPLPIYADRFGSYENTEGSDANILTNKAIVVNFSNLDIRYDYINLAVIKTIQGTPTYELVATLPISTEEYLYTGREVTKLLSIDNILGLYPDYFSAKSVSSANNYLFFANMSTQDEANYQPFANLIELEWVAVRRKADTFETTYKNPVNSVEIKGYQRGEVYAFAIQFLLSNGRKTSVFHIPGRTANPSDVELYTPDTIPANQNCNLYEFTSQPLCSEENISKLYKWQVYDTATITGVVDENSLDVCDESVVAWGDFAYWESTDTYPCNDEVWGGLAGQPIRHHKFPSNNTFHHHNSPYNNYTDEYGNYYNSQTFIYPMGIRLKKSLEFYVDLAVSLNILTQEEADLITGYEIVRSDRTGNKSVIAKGLMYNMRYYQIKNPSTGIFEDIGYPNYPFNDLKDDYYLNNKSGKYTGVVKSVTVAAGAYTHPYTIPAGNVAPFFNPFPVAFNSTSASDDIILADGDFLVEYSQQGTEYIANFYFYPDPTTGNARDAFFLTAGSPEVPNHTCLYYPNIFTFHSPDTSFKQPFLGSELNIHSLEVGVSYGRFDKVEGHPLIKPANKTKSANYACAFKAVGNYNSYIPVSQTAYSFRRRIEDSGYLVGNNTVRFPQSNFSVNNNFRESSVGLILSCDITDPVLADESRYTISEDDKCNCQVPVEDRPRDSKNAFEVNSQCTEDYKNISSYYASLKTKIPNQYGQIDTVRYVLTGSYHKTSDNPIAIFGGDTFITRFSLKRKHSFFNVNFIGQTPVGMTYGKSEYFNILSPVYHLDNELGGPLGEYKVDFSTSRLDCTEMGKQRNGFFYLFSTGVVNFFVESDINTELRYSLTNPWETWYPKLKNVDSVWDWMEEIKCSINFDNTYYYNFDYSKQNVEEALFPQAADFNPNSQCKNTHPRRIIYSKQGDQEASADKWLVFPANNYYDMDSALGDIIDIQALDTFRVLVRCVNGSSVFNAYDTLQLTNTSVTVGTGGMFSQRPQTFGETDNGYAGSQSKWAIDTTPFGTFFTDAKRGKVFNYSAGLEEISQMGMFDWFNENMSFKIKEQFPNINTDNPYNGIGYTSVYDYRLNLWFLTKRDYILKNPNDVTSINTDEFGNLFYQTQTNQVNCDGPVNIITPVNFEDETVWENVGWTISFSPLYKAWQSFHSFIPNYYIPDVNTFFSGLKQDSIYKHWDKFTFQNYYGKQYPFEITITTAKEELTSVLQSVEYNLKIQKYLNDNYQDIYENHNINFTKAIVSTDNQSSGVLNLIKKDNTNPYQTLQYPKVNPDSLDVLYSKIEGHKYRVNQFIDVVKDKNNNEAIFLYSKNGVDRYVNNVDYNKVLTLNNQPFRNEFFDVTLINDDNPEYKFILKTYINKTVKSLR